MQDTRASETPSEQRRTNGQPGQEGQRRGLIDHMTFGVSSFGHIDDDDSSVSDGAGSMRCFAPDSAHNSQLLSEVVGECSGTHKYKQT